MREMIFFVVNYKAERRRSFSQIVAKYVVSPCQHFLVAATVCILPVQSNIGKEETPKFARRRNIVLCFSILKDLVVSLCPLLCCVILRMTNQLAQSSTLACMEFTAQVPEKR